MTTNLSERLFSINLVQMMAAGNVRYSTNRDLAVVRFEEYHTNTDSVAYGLPGFSPLLPEMNFNVANEEWVCPFKEVDLGADVYMFGFPVSVTRSATATRYFDPTQPLLRKGSVAGISQDHHTIIIDCPAYFGNSGGPVIQIEHPMSNVTRLRIIGLVSAFMPFEEEWSNNTMRYSHVLKSNSGYTVVEPIDGIYELIPH